MDYVYISGEEEDVDAATRCSDDNSNGVQFLMALLLVYNTNSFIFWGVFLAPWCCQGFSAVSSLCSAFCCGSCIQCFSPQSPLSVWPAWHKQWHISDRRVLSRITRVGERRVGWGGGGQRRVAAQSEGLTDGKWSSLSLILRQADVPSPCVAGCWPGESQAAAEMKKLESSSGGELVIWCPAQEQECDAEWAEGGRERQPLQSVTKTHPDGQSRRKSRPEAAVVTPHLCWERKQFQPGCVCATSERSPSHHDRCSPSFIHLSNYTGDKRGGTATQICNLSFSEMCQTSQPRWSRRVFLTWHRLSLAGKGGPLKAAESLRWEGALPAEGSAMSKCQRRRAVINRQWWQPVVLQTRLASLSHDKPSRSGGVRQH